MPDPSKLKLTYAQRHPIQKQAFDDAIQLSWQQIGIPALGILGSLIMTLVNEYKAGRLHGWPDAQTFVYSLFWSLVIGVILYALVAIVRAPFIVIGRQNRELLDLKETVAELDLRPQTINGISLPFEPLDVTPRTITKTIELDPNIQALDPQMVKAYQQDGGVIVEGESTTGPTKKAIAVLVAPFHNRVPEGKEIGTANYISARTVCRSYATGSTREIDHVAWLSEDRSQVYFGWNETRKLIVLTLEDDGAGALRYYTVKRDLVGTLRGVETQRSELTQKGIFSVIVSLMHEMSGKVVRKKEYILEIPDDSRLTVNLESAVVWRQSRLNGYVDQGLALAERLAAESEETLWQEIDNWMLECKAFIKQQLSEAQSNIGQSLSELKGAGPLAKAMGRNTSMSERITGFCTQMLNLSRSLPRNPA